RHGGIGLQRDRGAKGSAIEPVQPHRNGIRNVVGQAVIDLVVRREGVESALQFIFVAAVFGAEGKPVDRGVPGQSAEQSDLGTVKEYVEIGAAGDRQTSARLEGRPQHAERV